MLGAYGIFVQFNLIRSVQKSTAAQIYERTHVLDVKQTTEREGVGEQLKMVTTMTHGRHATSVMFGSTWSQRRQDSREPTAVMQRCSVFLGLITCYIRYSKLHPLFHIHTVHLECNAGFFF